MEETFCTESYNYLLRMSLHVSIGWRPARDEPVDRSLTLVVHGNYSVPRLERTSTLNIVTVKAQPEVSCNIGMRVLSLGKRSIHKSRLGMMKCTIGFEARQSLLLVELKATLTTPQGIAH